MAEHIRIGDVAPRVQYVADGTQTVFAYPFPIFSATDLECLVNGARRESGFTIQGAGQSEGGSVTFTAAPAAGTRITLRRRMRIQRVTDFQPNGLLRADTLNDELDYQIAALQELRDEIASTLRADPSDPPTGLVLPARAGRANRVLGFDSAGAIALFNREGQVQPPFAGAVPRTVEEKLAETLSARDFGAVGDGVTDDGPALQAAMNAAAASGRHLVIGEGTHRTTIPLVLPGAAAGLTMRGAILYAGPGGEAALTLGDGGTTRNAVKLYQGLRVLRATQSDWLDERDIGILARNQDSSRLDIRQVEGFTIGIRTLGDERGFEDSELHLGRIVNNRIGLDVRTRTAAGWNTSVRYFGGHFAISSSVHPDKDRFGVRFSAEPGAYVAHNRHLFEGPAFELQSRDRPIEGIPFLIEVNSRAVIARGVRMEGCDAFVARHTAGAQDHLYEVAWASQGYEVDVDYAPGATRAGALVRRFHQALAHRELTRPVALVDNLRAVAFRQNATDTGFERMAAIASNTPAAASTLAEFAYAGLPNYTLTDRGVVLGPARGLGFVVETRGCRDFALALDADSPRLVVLCFDSAGALLTDAAGQLVLFSGASAVWNASARWWQTASDLTDAAATRLQAIRLAPQVATAIIGVARISADYEVRAMRLFCDPSFAPALLYGLPGLPHGVRELKAEAAWDPPSIAAGGSAQLNVPLPGVRPGDFTQASFSLSTSGVVFLANVGAQDVVTVTAWNRSGTAIDLAAGTVRVRAVKA
ncbi:MAG: phage tail fiber protein [Acetobacteraceae bacterium]|nr:phage tail fiber protein [Acetobacteraceae bacterium]